MAVPFAPRFRVPANRHFLPNRQPSQVGLVEICAYPLVIAGRPFLTAACLLQHNSSALRPGCKRFPRSERGSRSAASTCCAAASAASASANGGSSARHIHFAEYRSCAFFCAAARFASVVCNCWRAASTSPGAAAPVAANCVSASRSCCAWSRASRSCSTSAEAVCCSAWVPLWVAASERCLRGLHGALGGRHLRPGLHIIECDQQFSGWNLSPSCTYDRFHRGRHGAARTGSSSRLHASVGAHRVQ